MKKFENINSVKIVKDNRISYYPNILSLVAADELIDMINWLYEDAKNDLDEVEEIKKQGHWLDEWDKMSLRLGSRTLSYVNHLYVLEGVLIRMLKDLGEELMELNIMDGEELAGTLNSRKEIFEPINTFRNKVAGHTSYSNPKDDTPEQIVGSLLNLTPKNGSLVLGSHVFMGGYSGALPIVSILNYPIDKKYHEEWHDIFLKLIVRVYKEMPASNTEKRIEKRWMSKPVYKDD